MPDYVLQQGIDVVLQLQATGAWLAGPMCGLSFTGTTEFFLVALTFFYWVVDVRMGARLGLALMISLSLNWFLKVLFHEPRPFWLAEQVVLYGALETSFGVPSGHAQNSVIFWGMLAQALQRWWAWAAAVVLITGVGLSRVYLGVHFPTDVVAGWLIGALLLVAFLRLEDAALARYRSQSFALRSLLTFVVSVAVIGLGWLAASRIEANWSLPAEWVQRTAAAGYHGEWKPLEIETLATVMGTTFGLVVGADWMSRHGGFSTAGPWRLRVVRYLLGLVGALVIWQGLGMLFELRQPAWPMTAVVLRYARYALLAGWITALAPLLFVRWRLAAPATAA